MRNKPHELTKEQRAALIKRTDAETVERFISMVPEQLRPLLAEPLRPLFAGLIEHERQRCIEVMRIGTQYHRNEQNRIEGIVVAAIQIGQPVDGLSIKRACAEANVAAMETATRAVGVPPGSCMKCGGAKVVPTTVVLVGGQRPMVPCPVCVPLTVGAPPAAATAASISDSPGGG